MSEEGSGKKMALPIILAAAVLLVVVGVVGFILLKPGLSSEFPQAEFIANMNELVMQPQDMSVSYKIAAGSNVRVTNEQVVSVMGAERGKAYIQATNRIDGWDLYMERVNTNDIAPESYRTRVEIFQTADGASAALSPTWFWAYTDADKAPDEFLDKSCNIGNECILFKYNEAKPGSGAVRERFDVAFRYKNVLVWVFIKGTGGEVSQDLALDTAQTVLNRLKDLE